MRKRAEPSLRRSGEEETGGELCLGRAGPGWAAAAVLPAWPAPELPAVTAPRRGTAALPRGC